MIQGLHTIRALGSVQQASGRPRPSNSGLTMRLLRLVMFHTPAFNHDTEMEPSWTEHCAGRWSDTWATNGEDGVEDKRQNDGSGLEVSDQKVGHSPNNFLQRYESF